jgi:hypothetical protein
LLISRICTCIHFLGRAGWCRRIQTSWRKTMD